MAPVIRALEARSPFEIQSFVVSTGQHRELMQPILEFFGIKPDIDLGLMSKCKSLNELFSATVAEIDRICCALNPDVVLVHGDTTSAAASAIAAFHRGLKVGHVEAGLRTGDLSQPWPEEANRRLITQCTGVHFAPTPSAKARLIAEGIPAAAILVTGNTVIDALMSVKSRIAHDRALRARLDEKYGFLANAGDIVLVTGHRRENFGSGMESVCKGLVELSERGLPVVYPVHLNPNVLKPVTALLGGRRNIHLIPPASYVEFVYLMMRSAVILTDSGGVQEEAPSLGKPVLVTRNVTERPEAVAGGFAKLVGTDPAMIVDGVLNTLQRARRATAGRSLSNPFGDGHAAQRIVAHLVGKCAPEFGRRWDSGPPQVGRAEAVLAKRSTERELELSV